MGQPPMLHDAVLAAAPALAVAALIFGPITAWMAARLQRNPAIWLVFGAVLGPFAVAILAFAPPARCPNCAEPTAGFETRCSACGVDVNSRTPDGAAAAIPDRDPLTGRAIAIQPPAPVLRSLPDVPAKSFGEPRRIVARWGDAPGDARPGRLSAVGAHRPMTNATIGEAVFDGTRLDVTLLAMAVLVLGAEPLHSGSRYVIARTHDRLLIIGPIEASDEHVEFSLPLAGVEANFVADRLVISAVNDDRSHGALVLAFQSVASLSGHPVDEAIMEAAPPASVAAGRP
jgi:hypothetical protein